MESESSVSVISRFDPATQAAISGLPVLTDRIINVKLYRCLLDNNGVPTKDVSADFVTLHSDYELMESSSGSYFARCVQKPCITVSYKVYKGNTAPTLTLTITNFTPYVTDTTSSGLSFSDRPFRSVEIHMGYINQFADWSKVQFGETSYKNFINLSGDSEGVTVIRGSVLAVRKTKYAPDSEIVFDICPSVTSCGVPDVRNFLPDNSYLRTTEMVSDLYNALNAYKSVYTKDLPWSLTDFQNAGSGATFSQTLFYWLISRRYWDSYQSAGSNKDTMTSRIAAYSNADSKSAVSYQSNMESLRSKLKTDSGSVDNLSFLPDKPSALQRVAVGSQSLKYDIPYYLAAMLSEGATESQIKLELASYVKFYADTPEQMLARIKADVYPYLGWTSGISRYNSAGKTLDAMAASGQVAVGKAYSCLYLYDIRQENDAQSVKDSLVTGSGKAQSLGTMKANAVSFPAVYDITYSAVTVAHTPFFGMFPILYPVKFDKTFLLTDFVQYYIAPLTDTEYFSCYAMSVDFSTVNDDNECELQMTKLGDLYEG